MRNVHFYGKLKTLIPAPVRLDIDTPGEAIRAVAVQVPGFLAMLKEGSYRVVVGKNTKKGLDLELEDINDFRMGHNDLHIVPVVAGAAGKGGAMIKTILGAALIGAAIFMSGGLLAAPLAASGMLSGVTWGNIAMIGAAIALSGISQLITKPQENKDDKKQDSYSLSGPGNVYTQGNPVPLIYGGELITGGVLISGGIDIEKIG